MVTKQQPKKPEVAESTTDLSLPVRVDGIPKQVRKSSKLDTLVAWLTSDENVGGTYKLPPRTTAATIKRVLTAAGYDCEVASRSENGSRAHYVKVIGKTAAPSE